MKITIATAQYPINFHQSLTDWQKYTKNWVKSAVEQKAELLLFPEYGSMELTSLLSEEIRHDLQKQVLEMDSLKDFFCETYSYLAKKFEVIIVAPSFPVLENDKIYNRVFVFSKKGLVGFQDKFFMTRFENEEWGIASAPKVLSVFEAVWGSFGIQICYDIEFPIGSQLLCANGSNLILAPSCTETLRGATRVHVGARARALENQCYVAVSQTINNAEWSPAVDINFGYTAIYASPDKNLPEEGIVSIEKPQNEGWLIQELDFDLLKNIREDGQVFNFKDTQKVNVKLEEEIEVKRVKI
ncbi:carbon-nitrogen hydrolase family protein [Arcicella sp. LKC2W]|uniref:carbon-nitrogen hydrolase family protein n=1 Tax=Arcicella sp. LKC2W TaxID=2984198 RepID=UPI002B1FE0FE|nr:carbon-nitrogen hydrolase family protein [Arcicella sp. LKC2W]MEA5458452.1 carbon-nitrogen hydrolase family protein [Arcicella sp. LKC2W]